MMTILRTRGAMLSTGSGGRGGQRVTRTTLLAIAFQLALVVLAANARADGIRVQDEIVLVNVRPVGSCCDPAVLAQGVQIEAYQACSESGCRQWHASDLATITAADASVSTVIFVHGNRLTNFDAKCEGLAAYRRIARQATDPTPIRFVIFSWPSTQIAGPLKDVRLKAARTRPAGCQLAWFVDQLPAETPITMVGFSFGARIITGSLHILAGGSLGNCGLAERQHPDRQPVNAVLMAAALNSDWLCPGRYHGQAMNMVRQMVLVNNCNDMAMKYYHFSTNCGRPQALGLCGPTCIAPDAASRLLQINAGRYVSDHNLFCYLSVPGVTGEVWQLSHEPAGPVVAAN